MTEVVNSGDMPEIKSDCTGESAVGNHEIDWQLDEESNPIWLGSNLEEFQKFERAYSLAELDLKASEYIDAGNPEILVPGINELRYCSYHITKALAAGDESEQRDQLHRATRHCERASYDSLELRLTKLFVKIKEFNEKFVGESVVISEIIPKYAEDMAKIRSAHKLLSSNYKDKVTTFSEIREKLGEVEQIYYKLDAAQEDLKKSALRQNQKVKRLRLGFAISILSLLGGIFFYYLKTFEYQARINQLEQKIDTLTYQSERR